MMQRTGREMDPLKHTDGPHRRNFDRKKTSRVTVDPLHDELRVEYNEIYGAVRTPPKYDNIYSLEPATMRN